MVEFCLHNRQFDVLDSKANEILYGGAAGGGKSHLMRVLAIMMCYDIPKFQVYLFRRTYPDLIKNHVDNFLNMLAPFVEVGQCKIVEGEIRWQNGSKIHLCHCQHEKDIFNYQGAEIHLLLIDELTHFSEKMYRFLRGRCRVGNLIIPESWKNKLPMILCGSNPGGIGHQWVKRTFIEMCVPFEVRQMPDNEGGMRRTFIPARLEDNPTLTQNDPTYLSRLSGLGNQALVDAMRDGNWDIQAGAAFECLTREKHLLRNFELPMHWTKFMCIDWGTAKPYSVGWYCVCDEDLILLKRDKWGEMFIPKGSIIRYRELYGWNGKPDEGCREDSVTVAQKIANLEIERIDYRIGDSAMWAQHDGPSVAENMETTWAQMGLKCRTMEKSRKDRTANYLEFRKRLMAKDGLPSFFITEACHHFWRTVPDLQLDEREPEKGWDSSQEDHTADECAYALVSRPMIQTLPNFDSENYKRARKESFDSDRKSKKKPGRY